MRRASDSNCHLQLNRMTRRLEIYFLHRERRARASYLFRRITLSQGSDQISVKSAIGGFKHHVLAAENMPLAINTMSEAGRFCGSNYPTRRLPENNAHGGAGHRGLAGGG